MSEFTMQEYTEEDMEVMFEGMKKYVRDTTTLKPCPFCKSTHWCNWHVGHRKHPWATECMVCGASGPWADTEEEAKRLWNRRIEE